MEFMNRRLIERTGYDATGEPCYKVLHERDSVCPWCPSERVFQGETVRWEVQSPKDHRWYYVVNTPIFHPDGRVSKQTMIQDITERHRAEEELRQYREHLEDLVAERTAALAASEAQLRAIFEGAPIGICLRDLDGQPLAMNPALERIMGYNLEEYACLGWSFLHPEDAPRAIELFQDLAQERRPSVTFETRVFHKDGRLIWVRVHATVIPGKDEKPLYIVGLFEDITEEKHLQAEVTAYQERLRALAAELTHIEERERRRLAADLHDHVGQVLALIQIKLGAVRQELASPQGAAPLDEARQLLTGVIGATRSLTLELGIPVLHELGLLAGIEWLGERYQEQHGLEVVVDLEPLPAPLDDLKKTVLFRAVQELLTNVVKHAQARRVHISLKQEGEELKLMVADDGLGFEMSALTAVRGFGLFSIAERVGNLGGHLKLASAPGHGTQITITFPLDTGSQS
jgi:PAS domain S-box-containing protein